MVPTYIFPKQSMRKVACQGGRPERARGEPGAHEKKAELVNVFQVWAVNTVLGIL